MARPSRTGGKKSEAKARNASSAKGSKTTGKKRPVARAATRAKRPQVSGPSEDLKEAREEQAATAEILKVIASSPDDVQPVFEAIAASAKRLIGGFSAAVFRFVADVGYLAAFTPIHPDTDEVWKASFPRRLSDFLPFEWVRDGEPAQVTDTETEPAVRDLGRLRGGYRSLLVVPLVSDGAPIGLVSVTRREPGTFAPHHVRLLQTFADQAVIAIENARMFNETQEALERQTATADILKVIASSPDDVQPVFDAIAGRSKRLVNALSTTVHKIVDGMMHLAAFTPTNPEADATLRATFPAPLSQFSWGESIRRGEIYRVTDTENEPDGLRDLARQRGWRSCLCVPLLRDGKPIGMIGPTRAEPGPFADHDVQLLRTFADQAVIAIENARLFDEVQARTRDLSELLQQQTATADVLKVISRSTFDLQKILDTLTESVCQLCDAYDAVILLREGNYLRITAHYGEIPVVDRWPISRDWISGRAVVDRKPVHIHDLLAEEAEFPRAHAFAQQTGHRTLFAVPLLREQEVVGAISIRRTEVRPFTDRQIELVQTFADQAVIAIENARLFEEVQAKTRDLSEALIYQTGSANILKVIASSPTDVNPVLEAIVKNACELCEAYDAVAVLKDGDYLRFGGHHGPIPMNIEKWPINRRWTAGRAFIDQKPVHVHDLLAEGDEFPDGRELSQRMGHRSIVSVPLLRENESIGALVLRRKEVRPFNEKQITLLQTFADQAVIAIGNVHLFEEVQARTRDLSEALTYQTGSANILNVIASSPTDVWPVLKAIVESACELCEAYDAVVILKDGEELLLSAHHGPIPMNTQRWANDRSSVSGRAMADLRPIHVHDVLAEEGQEFAMARRMSLVDGCRTLLSAPLIREGEPIGTLVLRRIEVHPFSDRQIALLQTFADQAVIAIENVRLFNETKEALERQTATADILKVIASSPSDVQPVFAAIAERSNRLVDGLSTAVYSLVGDTAHLMAFTPVSPTADAALQAMFPAPLSQLAWNESILDGKTFVITDAEVDFATNPAMSELARLRGWRSSLAVPLLRDGRTIGVITVTRVESGRFDDHHVQLLQTFADQAVIAIGNARLFDEVQQRTKELAASLDDLRTAQDRLVQTEKLASLGQLTAGIAHEIKNPLNFVNNFSALSVELTDELNDTLKPVAMNHKVREEVDELTGMLKDNLRKVVQHGKRADSIVKNMLLHSREGSGERRSTDINALVDESLNLAYHGARAEKSGFNIILHRDFDASAGSAELFPQEITRALLNLISNGFYAATKRKSENGGAEFEPTLLAATKNLGSSVEIRIRDNGTGIPPEVKEKMFNPFFTTKPAGEGTGLGLSMTHDIVVKQHGGRIDVVTEPGQFTEFTIVLPRSGAKQ